MNKIITIEVVDGLFKSPHFEGHKRGRNWAAILNGRNAANLERDSLKKTGGGRYYDVGALQADPLLKLEVNIRRVEETATIIGIILILSKLTTTDLS